jgi:cytoskeletal protein RodZ
MTIYVFIMNNRFFSFWLEVWSRFVFSIFLLCTRHPFLILYENFCFVVILLIWSFYSIWFVILLYFYWPSVFFQFTLTLNDIKSTSDSANSNYNNKNTKIRDDSKNTTKDDLKCSSSNDSTMKTIPEEKNTFENNPKSKLTNGKIATDHDSDDSSVWK